MQSRDKGIIKRWFADRGYGFIRVASAGEPDIFFRGESVGAGDDNQPIEAGRLVEFNVRMTPKGLRAVDVLLV